MKNKRLAAGFLVLFVTFSETFACFADEPVKAGAGWNWQDDNGNKLRNAFAVIEGEQYYFGSSGLLETESMVHIDGELYYCDENGRCVKNIWKKLLDPQSGEKGWYYFTATGKAFREGWIRIAGKMYHFSNWNMDHGWYTEENDRGEALIYYLGTEEEGAAASGWIAWKENGLSGEENHETGWYYFQPSSCRMVYNMELEIDGSRYAFNSDGRMAAGFVSIDGKEKYFEPSTGKLASGWVYVQDTAVHPEGWYYFKAGQALSAQNGTDRLSDGCGTAKIDGAFYGFDEVGKMLTGVVSGDNGKYYCFGKDGILATGYIDVGLLEGYDGRTADLPAEKMFFQDRGAAPPVLGSSFSGAEGEYVYRNGVRLYAEKDNFETVDVETENGLRTFVIGTDGKIRRSGTVVQKNGEKKTIRRKDEDYILE